MAWNGVLEDMAFDGFDTQVFYMTIMFDDCIAWVLNSCGMDGYQIRRDGENKGFALLSLSLLPLRTRAGL